MKKLHGFCETHLFLGNNRQYMPVFAEMTKMISSWVQKFLSMAMTHMSLGMLQVVAASAALVAGVSLVSTLPAGDWTRVSTPAGHYFQHISLLQIGTRILCSFLSWALVKSQLGKCQTLTYIRSHKYVRLLGHHCPQYCANSFPVVCTVLALNNWNYCSGEQGKTDQYPLFNVCPKGFIE